MSAYQLTLQHRDPPHTTVVVPLGEKPPTPSAPGEGGWEAVALPKRSAVSIWRGRGLLQMAIPIIIDGAGEKPVGPVITPLLQMWRPTQPTVEPPVLEISSPGDAVPYADLEWVLADIEWGEAEGDAEGRRTQQQMTLVLMEYRADERVQTADAAKRKGHGKVETYRVKRKDLAHGLGGIAERLKVPGGWKTLGLAQHPQIHDPRRIRVGQVLQIPTVEHTKRGTIISWLQPLSS